MSRVRLILKGGKPAFVVVPIDLWERVRKAAEGKRIGAVRSLRRIAAALDVPLDELAREAGPRHEQPPR